MRHGRPRPVRAVRRGPTKARERDAPWADQGQGERCAMGRPRPARAVRRGPTKASGGLHFSFRNGHDAAGASRGTAMVKRLPMPLTLRHRSINDSHGRGLPPALTRPWVTLGHRDTPHARQDLVLFQRWPGVGPLPSSAPGSFYHMIHTPMNMLYRIMRHMGEAGRRGYRHRPQPMVQPLT